MYILKNKYENITSSKNKYQFLIYLNCYFIPRHVIFYETESMNEIVSSRFDSMKSS
jgi:hypothetical protein